MKLHEEFKLYETMWDDNTTSLKEGWDDQVALADKHLNLIVNKTGNNVYDDEDGYWSGDNEWCNRYMYYSNSVANVNQVQKLCDKYSTDVCTFYVFEDDAEEDPVSEIGYTLTNLDNADDDAIYESKKLTEAAPTNDYFTWTVGSESYDIGNNSELRAYIKAAAEEKLSVNAAKYAQLHSDDDKVWSAYYDVFEELITYYETQKYVDHQFINRLRVLKERILGDLHLDYDKQQVQQDVEALATACMEQFLKKMKKLTAFYKYNIDEPYCQNPIDTIKEELVDLGVSLACPNYINN